MKEEKRNAGYSSERCSEEYFEVNSCDIEYITLQLILYIVIRVLTKYYNITDQNKRKKERKFNIFCLYSIKVTRTLK